MSGARRGRVYGVAGENLGSFTGDAGCGGRAHGMRGEQRTAVLLDGLAGRGFTVLHSVRVCGGAADIDHVLIGSRGVVLIDTKTWRAGVYVRLGSRAYRWVAGAVLPGRFTPAESTSLARSVEQMRGAGVPVVGAVVAVWPSGAGRVRLGLMRYAGARRIAAARRAVRVAARMAGARGADEVVVERVLRWAGAGEEGR